MSHHAHTILPRNYLTVKIMLVLLQRFIFLCHTNQIYCYCPHLCYTNRAPALILTDTLQYWSRLPQEAEDSMLTLSKYEFNYASRNQDPKGTSLLTRLEQHWSRGVSLPRNVGRVWRPWCCSLGYIVKGVSHVTLALDASCHGDVGNVNIVRERLWFWDVQLKVPSGVSAPVNHRPSVHAFTLDKTILPFWHIPTTQQNGCFLHIVGFFFFCVINFIGVSQSSRLI